MVKKIGWFVFIFLLVITVYASATASMKKYTIDKGDHRSGLRYKPFRNKNTVNMAFRFDSTAVYQLEDNDQYDLNKLAGLAFGRSHHTNSARICWRYNSEKKVVELFSYIYDDKNRAFTHITDCEIGSECNATIVVKDKTVEFTINDISKTFDKSKWPNWGYRLYPYFGGDRVAPHDISIWLDMKVE